MKKKIIITALSLMIASSTIIPAYAAEPRPTVDSPLDIPTTLNTWSDQFVEECTNIQDPRERYLHIVHIIADNLVLNNEHTFGEQVLIDYNTEGITEIMYYTKAIVDLSVKCGLEAYVVRVQGNGVVDDARTNYWPGVYLDDTLYLTSPMSIETGEDFNTFALIPNGTYGVHVTRDPRLPVEEEVPPTEEELKFTVTFDPFDGTRIFYDSDGTWVHIAADLSFENMTNSTDKYYICENYTLHPTTLDELRKLGYTGDVY